MDMTIVLGIVGSLLALILAWRAYRSAAADDEAGKREKDDRSNRS